MKKLLLYFLLLSLTANAHEGMWTLPELKEQNAAAMRELGLDMDPDRIYSEGAISLKDAVVHFGSGCTGEIISSEGLILTNHHCGYNSIQHHSSVEHDYLTNGFWAMSRDEELPCPGLAATFIDKILEVTTYVNNQLAKDGDPQGTNYLSPNYLKTVAQRFAKENNLEITPATVLELKPMYGGNRYYLFVKIKYSDIRMVGAPPSSIGKFGADTDNWMWPRHTGDFSIFRIYADAEGRPADYAPTNLPLKVKRHLTLNIGGVKEGDFTFVLGFPGSNFRYMISDEVEERMKTVNFMRDRIRGVRQEALKKEMQTDAATRIQYAGKYARSANYWKNAIGMNYGLTKLHVLDTKRAQQEALIAYGAEKGNSTYLKAYNDIRAIVESRHSLMYHQQALLEALNVGTEFSQVPSTEALIKALQSEDPKQIDSVKANLQVEANRYFDKNYNPQVDRSVSREMLKLYCELIPTEQRVSIFRIIDQRFKGDTGAFVDAAFKHSIFASKEHFDKFIKRPNLNKLEKDWMVLYAYSVRQGIHVLAAAMKESGKAYADAHKIWVGGMMEMKQQAGTPIYPDANSTLRLTYGQIRPYSPADGAEYAAFTTLKGVMEKEDAANNEFVVPTKLKQLYQTKDYGRYARKSDGEIPVCFITNTDNTGGNSGSPVFNAHGELVGTAFDRNYEGLTGDVAFQPDLQRAACVDIRYILFIIEKYAGAAHLIDEMTIVE